MVFSYPGRPGSSREPKYLSKALPRQCFLAILGGPAAPGSQNTYEKHCLGNGFYLSWAARQLQKAPVLRKKWFFAEKAHFFRKNHFFAKSRFWREKLKFYSQNGKNGKWTPKHLKKHWFYKGWRNGAGMVQKVTPKRKNTHFFAKKWFCAPKTGLARKKWNLVKKCEMEENGPQNT